MAAGVREELNCPNREPRLLAEGATRPAARGQQAARPTAGPHGTSSWRRSSGLAGMFCPYPGGGGKSPENFQRRGDAVRFSVRSDDPALASRSEWGSAQPRPFCNSRVQGSLGRGGADGAGETRRGLHGADGGGCTEPGDVAWGTEEAPSGLRPVWDTLSLRLLQCPHAETFRGAEHCQWEGKLRSGGSLVCTKPSAQT